MKNEHINVNRILVIDDEASIHATYRTVLCPEVGGSSVLDALDAELFGGETKAPAATDTNFQVDTASQGQQGLEMLKAAIAEKRPYRMAFVDMNPPTAAPAKAIRRIRGLAAGDISLSEADR